MTSAILQTAHYLNLAEQCDRCADVTRITAEREFYSEQAAIFRRLAKVKERRDAAESVAAQENGCRMFA